MWSQQREILTNIFCNKNQISFFFIFFSWKKTIHNVCRIDETFQSFMYIMYGIDQWISMNTQSIDWLIDLSSSTQNPEVTGKWQSVVWYNMSNDKFDINVYVNMYFWLDLWNWLLHRLVVWYRTELSLIWNELLDFFDKNWILTIKEGGSDAGKIERHIARHTAADSISCRHLNALWICRETRQPDQLTRTIQIGSITKPHTKSIKQSITAPHVVQQSLHSLTWWIYRRSVKPWCWTRNSLLPRTAIPWRRDSEELVWDTHPADEPSHTRRGWFSPGNSYSCYRPPDCRAVGSQNFWTPVWIPVQWNSIQVQ